MISGASGSTAFFLQPYEELVQMQWSVYQPDSQAGHLLSSLKTGFKAALKQKKIIEKNSKSLKRP